MADLVAAATAAFAAIITAATGGAVAGTAATAIASAAINIAAGAALQAGVNALSRPAATVSHAAAIDFKADPDAPISFALGRGAVAGNICHANVHGGSNRYLTYIVALSGGGPIEQIEKFLANETQVSFVTDGGEGGNGDYQHRMWQKVSLGAAGTAALAMTATGTKDTPADHGPLTEWTSAHKLSGIAHAMWTLSFDPERAYPAGVPKPLWVVKGIKVYDPRQDSTYPGGSGAQRWGDASTYAWSANPYVHALNWLLGYWQNGKRVGGCGVPMAGIDVAAFVEGMNAADANGWTMFGVPSTAMNKWAVLAAMLQAGGGEPTPKGALISCTLNVPKTSVATVTAADLAGPGSVETTASWRDRINKIVPKYVSEAHKWETVAATAVSKADYVTEDGGERSREVLYEFVTDVQQVTELAALDLATLREHKTVTLALKPYLMDLRPGSAFTLTLPEADIVGQKFVVTRRRFDPSTFVSTITARMETDAKHTWAFSLTGTAPYVPPAVTSGGDLSAPGATAWAVAGGTVSSSGGASVPAVIVTGESDNTQAARLVVVYRKAGETVWLPGYDGPPLERVEIAGQLAPSTAYEVEIGYRLHNSQPTARRAYAAVTTGSLTAGSATGVPADGSNRVRYAGMEAGTRGWGVTWNPDGLTAPAPTTGADTAGRKWTKVGATFTAGSQAYEIGQVGERFRVTPGERLSVQMRLETTGAVGWTEPSLTFLDAAGAWLASGPLDGFSGLSTFGTARQGFVNVPVGAAQAYVAATVYASGAGAFTLAIAEPMVASAHADQTVHPQFAAGPSADSGATVGGQFGENILRPNGDPAPDADYFTASGTAAAITGQGALATKSQASWTADVSGRPTELTDGRVSAGLTSTGDLNRNISTTRANGSNLLRYTAGGLFTGELAADVTATHTAAGFTGQGALATKSAVDFATSEVTNRTAGNLTYSGGTTVESLKPAEAGATLGGVFGTNLRETAGGTVATLANFKTASGTAAAIAGQGELATKNRATRMTKSAPSADVTLNAIAVGVTPQEIFNFTHTGGGGEAVLMAVFDLSGSTTCNAELYVYLDGTFVWSWDETSGNYVSGYVDAPRRVNGINNFSFMFDLGVLSAGSHTIRVYAAKAIGGTTSVVKTRRAVVLESIT